MDFAAEPHAFGRPRSSLDCHQGQQGCEMPQVIDVIANKSHRQGNTYEGHSENAVYEMHSPPPAYSQREHIDPQHPPHVLIQNRPGNNAGVSDHGALMPGECHSTLSGHQHSPQAEASTPSLSEKPPSNRRVYLPTEFDSPAKIVTTRIPKVPGTEPHETDPNKFFWISEAKTAAELFDMEAYLDSLRLDFINCQILQNQTKMPLSLAAIRRLDKLFDAGLSGKSPESPLPRPESATGTHQNSPKCLDIDEMVERFANNSSSDVLEKLLSGTKCEDRARCQRIISKNSCESKLFGTPTNSCPSQTSTQVNQTLLKTKPSTSATAGSHLVLLSGVPRGRGRPPKSAYILKTEIPLLQPSTAATSSCETRCPIGSGLQPAGLKDETGNVVDMDMGSSQDVRGRLTSDPNNRFENCGWHEMPPLIPFGDPPSAFEKSLQNVSIRRVLERRLRVSADTIVAFTERLREIGSFASLVLTCHGSPPNDIKNRLTILQTQVSDVISNFSPRSLLEHITPTQSSASRSRESAVWGLNQRCGPFGHVFGMSRPCRSSWTHRTAATISGHDEYAPGNRGNPCRRYSALAPSSRPLMFSVNNQAETTVPISIESEDTEPVSSEEDQYSYSITIEREHGKFHRIGLIQETVRAGLSKLDYPDKRKIIRNLPTVKADKNYGDVGWVPVHLLPMPTGIAVSATTNDVNGISYPQVRFPPWEKMESLPATTTSSDSEEDCSEIDKLGADEFVYDPPRTQARRDFQNGVSSPSKLVSELAAGGTRRRKMPCEDAHSHDGEHVVLDESMIDISSGIDSDEACELLRRVRRKRLKLVKTAQAKRYRKLLAQRFVDVAEERRIDDDAEFVLLSKIRHYDNLYGSGTNDRHLLQTLNGGSQSDHVGCEQLSQRWERQSSVVAANPPNSNQNALLSLYELRRAWVGDDATNEQVLANINDNIGRTDDVFLRKNVPVPQIFTQTLTMLLQSLKMQESHQNSKNEHKRKMGIKKNRAVTARPAKTETPSSASISQHSFSKRAHKAAPETPRDTSSTSPSLGLSSIHKLPYSHPQMACGLSSFAPQQIQHFEDKSWSEPQLTANQIQICPKVVPHQGGYSTISDEQSFETLAQRDFITRHADAGQNYPQASETAHSQTPNGQLGCTERRVHEQGTMSSKVSTSGATPNGTIRSSQHSQPTSRYPEPNESNSCRSFAAFPTTSQIRELPNSQHAPRYNMTQQYGRQYPHGQSIRHMHETHSKATDHQSRFFAQNQYDNRGMRILPDNQRIPSSQQNPTSSPLRKVLPPNFG